MALPDVVSREDWLAARRRLLAEEKELTRRRDALNTERRQLPMVRVDKEYLFDGPNGRVSLAGLFGDRRQLVVQHIMFGPDWDAACPVCTEFTSQLGDAFIARLTDFGDNRPLWQIAAGPDATAPAVRDELRRNKARRDEVRRALDIARHWHAEPRTQESQETQELQKAQRR